MVTPNLSITFNGTAEEAFNFYRSIFGGEFQSFMRWKDMPGRKASPDDNKIMHASLAIGKSNVIMGGDMPETMRSQLSMGNNFVISLECESKEEASDLYHALAEGGTEDPMMPLGDAFWGAYAGFLTDKFGIRWMVNYTYPKK